MALKCKKRRCNYEPYSRNLCFKHWYLEKPKRKEGNVNTIRATATASRLMNECYHCNFKNDITKMEIVIPFSLTKCQSCGKFFSVNLWLLHNELVKLEEKEEQCSGKKEKE